MENLADELQLQNKEILEFLSWLPVANTNKTESTPEPFDSSTPRKESDIQIVEINEIKLIPQQKRQTKAIKLTNQLQRKGFWDTGYLNHALIFEKHVIAWTMYYKLGIAIYYELRHFDPQDKFVGTKK